jgi:hypothetical protein
MWRLSTGLRNALLERAASVPNAVAASTISFGDGDGTGGRDTINDTANGLGSFLEKAYITVLGSANNNITAKILSVAAGVVEVAAGSLVNEAAGASVVLASAEGGSYRGLFRNCTIKLFTGAQPASADDAETGTELCQITLSSGAFVAGAPANGLNFGQVASAQLHKEVDEIWSGVNGADGVAGWFRIYDNDAVTGASTTAVRLDGACATSGAQLNLTNTSLVNSVTTTIDQVNLSMPAQ